MSDAEGTSFREKLVLVTGVSGAGKSSALKALEDLGFETVDNLPLSLIDRLVAAEGAPVPLAAGIDIRTRDFEPDTFSKHVARLKRRGGLEVHVLFMDCHDDVLARRFAETRRRHPLAIDRPVADGVQRERALMAPVRELAGVVMDTTDLSPGDAKRLLENFFGETERQRLSLHVQSFAYKGGVPRDADLVFDVRFLRNPHYVAALRPLTGKAPSVRAHIEKDAGFPAFFQSLTGLLDPLLPRYEAEGKSYLTIAVGCTGGRHRSVFVAERLTGHLRNGGLRVHLRHRDLDKSQV